MVFPAKYFSVSGAIFTIVSISAEEIVNGIVNLNRTFPLKEIGYSKASSTRYFSSHWGKAAAVTLPVFPS